MVTPIRWFPGPLTSLTTFNDSYIYERNSALSQGWRRWALQFVNLNRFLWPGWMKTWPTRAWTPPEAVLWYLAPGQTISAIIPDPTYSWSNFFSWSPSAVCPGLIAEMFVYVIISNGSVVKLLFKIKRLSFRVCLNEQINNLQHIWSHRQWFRQRSLCCADKHGWDH